MYILTHVLCCKYYHTFPSLTSDDFENERTKLIQQSQQLSRDLEQTREQVSSKNRDNLHLQEQNLTLDEKYRDIKRTSRQAEDGLKAEENTREALERR